ncbi:MAG: hypothetical protein DMF20_09305 [Verrucomicrobia bacterium]|nr:MAG: hypothetical protein DMF20_09305 [Verrucomicrobiota bacterium]
MKKVKPVFASRTARSVAWPDGSFSTSSRLIDGPSVPGSAGAFCEIKPIDPDAAPRKRLLKTRMGKKESASTANCTCTAPPVAVLIPFRRLRSSSIIALPLSTIIFCRVPVGWFELSGLF